MTSITCYSSAINVQHFNCDLKAILKTFLFFFFLKESPNADSVVRSLVSTFRQIDNGNGNVGQMNYKMYTLRGEGTPGNFVFEAKLVWREKRSGQIRNGIKEWLARVRARFHPDNPLIYKQGRLPTNQNVIKRSGHAPDQAELGSIGLEVLWFFESWKIQKQTVCGSLS